jgi:hypothetical protein
MRKLKTLILGLVMIFVASSFALAQGAGAPTGKFEGRITDNQGVALPGVTIEATSPKLVGKAVTVSDANGAYRLLALPSGVYEITFTLEGFKKLVRKDVVMQLQQTIILNVTMELAAIEETVTVVGMSPLIDVKSTVKGMTITKEVFNSLPKGRNFDSLITAIPGVSNEPMIGGTSVDGASGLENMYYVDGADITNLVTGTRAQSAAFEFVDEVQVRASGYQAEYGGSLGGVVSVITRSGGNAFHGEVLGYWSGASLRGKQRDILAQDWQDQNVAVYYPYNTYYGVDHDNRYEVGGSLGGYIWRDHLWFFGSFLPVFYNNTRDVTYVPRDMAQRSWKRTETSWNWNAKLTAQLFGKLRLSASVVNNFYKYKGDLSTGMTDSPDPAISYDDYGFSYPNISGAVTADLTIGNNFLTSIRGGYFRTDRNAQLVRPPDEPCFQFLTEQPMGYTQTTNIGLLDVPVAYQRPTGYRNYARGNAFAVQKNLNEKYSVAADFTYFLNAAGEHAFKAGAAWVRQGQFYDETAPNPVLFIAWNRDLIAYGTNYGRGKYGYYAARGNEATGPYGSFYKAFSNRWAIYLQDSWTISNRVTLNLGVRTESEYIPSYATGNPVWENVIPLKFDFGEKLAPRIGVVWDVYGDSSLKLFASVGWYYDVMKLQMAADSYGGFKWKSVYYALDTYEWDKLGVGGNFPGRLLYTPSPDGTLDFRAPSFESTDPDVKPMSQREISLGGEYKLREDLSLSVRGVYKHLLWAIEDMGVLLPASGESYFTSNPGGAFINKMYDEAKAADLMPANAPYLPKAKREYYAINIALDKRFSNNWQGGMSLTYSRLTGNYSGLASGDESQGGTGRSQPNIERYFDLWYLARDIKLNPYDGALPGDRPLYFKFYGSYTFKFGLTAGLIINAMSGIPTSTELEATSGWLPYNRNDLGRSPFLWFTNLYLAYDIKIKGNTKFQINCNVDNLFDVATAQRKYSLIFLDGGVAPEDVLATGNWDPYDYDPTPDPRYNMKMNFYPPIQVRLGVNFSF